MVKKILMYKTLSTGILATHGQVINSSMTLFERK